jgi:hypothetical protein
MKTPILIEHVQVELRAPGTGAVFGRVDMTPGHSRSFEVVTAVDSSLPSNRFDTAILIEEVRIQPAMDLELKIADVDVLEGAIEEEELVRRTPGARRCSCFKRILLRPATLVRAGCLYRVTAFPEDNEIRRIRVELWGARFQESARVSGNVRELAPPLN